MENLIWAKSLRISLAVKLDFSFQHNVFRTSNTQSATKLICSYQKSHLDWNKVTWVCMESEGKQSPSFLLLITRSQHLPWGWWVTLFSAPFSQVPSIKTSWMGQESRQTSRLINRQEGQRTGWQRTIKFDYQTLSSDALYLFPAIRLLRFLNEKPASGPVPDLSVGEEF